MSSSGTSETRVSNFSGYLVRMMPISNPPVLPPRALNCSTSAIPRFTKSVVKETKSQQTRVDLRGPATADPARPYIPVCWMILKPAIAVEQCRARLFDVSGPNH